MKAIRHYQIMLLLVVMVAILHQFLQKGLGIDIPFFHAYLDDFLCMPILLALWRWERQLWWEINSFRKRDIIYFTLGIFLLFEMIIPRYSISFTADWYDGIAYTCGSLLYWKFQPG